MKRQTMNQEEKVTYMTTQPVKGLVCEMAVPTIISMLVTSFYNMADTFFVGKINTQATADLSRFFCDGADSGAGIFLWAWIGKFYFKKTGGKGLR